jgi:hypothetical protein
MGFKALEFPRRTAKQIEKQYINIFFPISDELIEPTNQKYTDPPPEWVIVGESVLIRPYNTSGVIGFVGPTNFQVILLLFSILNLFFFL